MLQTADGAGKTLLLSSEHYSTLTHASAQLQGTHNADECHFPVGLRLLACSHTALGASSCRARWG